MASAGERPDLEALRELEDVLRHLAEELASWRRRALTAESRVADAHRGEGGDGAQEFRELEEERRTLEQRLGSARDRVTALLGRLDFLEEQSGNGEDNGSETAK